MKTLSIRQPWADLIVQGRKTLELRTWTVRHRGPLAIHAGQTVEREACLAHGLDPDQVMAGAVIGVVNLFEIDELDAESFAARRAEHLVDEVWSDGPLYGWRLALPQPLPEPMPVRGRMGLFETPVSLEYQPEPETRPAPPARSSRRSGDRAASARTFELRTMPVAVRDPGEPAYRLALYQRNVESPPDQRELYESEPALTHKVAELGGSTLRAVADHVLEALRASGYRPTDLGPNRREPFTLAEETGVRLGLLFLAVKPVTKMERIEVIAQGVRTVTSEEAYYWYAKCTSGPAAERAQRALRVLFAEE